MLRQAARAAPHRPAASLGEATLTFGELDAAANRLGHALRGLGVGRGDRVAWWGDASLDVVALFFALAKIGAVFAPVNARLGPEEAAPVVRRARPRLLVAGGARAEAAEGLAMDCEAPLARLGGAPGPGASLAEAAAGASEAEPADPGVEERDPHVIFFTSGSTGEPKGVVLSHRADWLRTFRGTMPEPPGATVCMFPLFHMAAWTIALGCWHARQQVCFVEAADAERILDAAQRHRAARLYCIPAVWRRILDREPRRWDLGALREADTGTSATPPELIAALKEAFPGTATRVFYGSTEAGPCTILADEDVERKPGSVGPPVAGVDLRLGEDGEVRVRSDFLMDGYFEDPEATALALGDGWYRTGDLGSLDAEGYLSIVGRLRDVIRTGGETVAPAEVEAVVARHPAVAEVAVVGVPDPAWGEVVCAVVVPRPGARLDLDELRRHCEGLAAFKRPRRLEVVEALPRTAATGQVQRSLLVERLAARAPGRA